MTIRDRNESKAITNNYERTNAAVIRSPNTYFQKGITFSRTGVYSPTFRFSSNSVYDTEGSIIFDNLELDILQKNGVYSSIILRYLVKNYIGHTVHCQVDELKELPITIQLNNQITSLVERLVDKQKQNARYEYMSHEQKEIDRLVYELYGLNKCDITEVENWFARRYPKLARFMEID